MSQKYQAQLHHADPKQRAMALKAIVQERDYSALPILGELQLSDPDPRIRKMALEGAKRLQAAVPPEMMNTKPPTSDTPTPSAEAPKPIKRLKPAAAPPPKLISQLDSTANTAGAMSIEELDRIKHERAAGRKTTASPLVKQDRARTANARKGRYSARGCLFMLVFMVAILGGAALIISSMLPVPIMYALQMARINNLSAEPLPAPGSSALQAPLRGNLYYRQLNAKTSYLLLEPNGDPNPRGYPLMIGIHGSGGRGRDMLGMGALTRAEGVILVTPTFSPVEPGGHWYDTQYLIEDTIAIYNDVRVRYDLDNNATVLYGFSMGGQATGGFVATYPDFFDGAGVLGARQIDVPRGASSTRYVVITGANDERRPAAEQFIATMNSRGQPVWYGHIEPGVGHTMSMHMMDKLMELMDSLRG